MRSLIASAASYIAIAIAAAIDCMFHRLFTRKLLFGGCGDGGGGGGGGSDRSVASSTFKRAVDEFDSSLITEFEHTDKSVDNNSAHRIRSISYTVLLSRIVAFDDN